MMIVVSVARGTCCATSQMSKFLKQHWVEGHALLFQEMMIC